MLSDGRRTKHVKQVKPVGLTDLYATYEERLPKPRKEESTLVSERIHMKHLKKHLRPNRGVQSITKSILLSYASKRLKEKWRGKAITPDTVRNDLVTLRMLWNWAVKEDLLIGTSPTRDVVFPLSNEKQSFMTRTEINEIISRGCMTKKKEKEL